MGKKLITISGCSAAGKSFFVENIIKTFPDFREVLGLTTRSIRKGEINGKSGIFITLEKMEQLEQSGQLTLVKEFFGNKYAWYKKDLINSDENRIVNISYRSVDELIKKGLNIYSIFVRPCTEEKMKNLLLLRGLSEEEYQKRMKDYYESEKFIENNGDKFNLVFNNYYNNDSLISMLKIIEQVLLNDNKVIQNKSYLNKTYTLKFKK